MKLVNTLYLMVLAMLPLLALTEVPKECGKMDDEMKDSFEEVYGTGFMGCKLGAKDSMRAIKKLHWLFPSGERGLEMTRSRTGMEKKLGDMGMKGKAQKVFMAGVKVAGGSLGKTGMLTASTGCLTELEPDFVAALLASSKTPKVFNAKVQKECKKRGVSTAKTARFSVVQVTVVRFVLCISVVLLILLLFGTFGALTIPLLALVTQVKVIVETIFIIIPFPSVPARIIEAAA